MRVGRGLLIKASVSPAGHRYTIEPSKLYNAMCVLLVLFVDGSNTCSVGIYQRNGVDF